MYERMIVRFNIILCLGLFLLVACASSDDTMSLENIRYVTDFPITEKVSDGELLNLDLFGQESLSVQDSLLIVQTRNSGGIWAFYNIADYSLIGKFLRMGRGEGELLFAPRVSDQAFYDKGQDRCCTIYDFSSGKLLEVNISETVRSKSLCLLGQAQKLERTLFNVVKIDSATYFCRRVDDRLLTQDRFLVCDGVESSNQSMDILNKSVALPGDDVNILNAKYCYNSERDILIEAPIHLNYLNAYSVFGDSLNVTLFQNRKPYTVSYIRNQIKPLRIWAYTRVAAYEDFFAALYQYKSIQFYDWDLSPLANLVLDKDINSFDIDVKRRVLYTVNYETDEVWTYDISDFLNRL